MDPMSNVPVLILAGGLGTRISEETHMKPKPMIEIGDHPILLHIMRYYYNHGFNDFVICAGYRSWEIKDYFLNYKYRQSHMMIDHRDSMCDPVEIGTHAPQEKWRVRVVDTGLETMTGARVAKALDVISETDSFENFAVTYGDGLTGACLREEFDFHLEHGKIGTVLGVPPLSRFGEMDISDEGSVTAFLEKPEAKTGLINGGYFFFKKAFRNYLTTTTSCILERDPLQKLAADKQLKVHEYRGFWQCMDTLRDKNHLQSIWDSGEAPWRPNVL